MKYIARSTRKSLIIAIIIGTIGGLTAIGMFSLSGLMLSKSAFKVPLYTLMTLVATIKLFGVIRAICKYYERLISHEATFEMLKDVRIVTVSRLFDNFLAIQSTYQLSTLLNRTVNDIEKLQNLLLRVIYPPIIAMVTTMIVAFVYAQFSLYAVIVFVCAIVLLTLVLPMIVSRYMKRIVNNKQAAVQQFEAQLMDYQLSYEAIKVFDTKQNYYKQLLKRQSAMERMIDKEHHIIIFYDFMLNTIAMVAIFLVICVMMVDPTLNTMMYLSMVMVAITLFEMSVPMIHYPYHKNETDASIQHIDALNKTINYDAINQAPQSITLNDVSVDHRLNNINMTIQQGQIIGITGQSGAGKTTLIRTILGLEKISGTYQLNGALVETPAHLLEMFNVMSQENHFINGTVADNMMTEVDDATLNQWLKHFNLPFNSNSEIQSFGENLSGGEKQRLHFIRMILRDKPIWILDEPFNGVDRENATVMLNYLKELQHHTIIIVSHDLSVFEICDTLYLIEKGQIIEQGNATLLHSPDAQLYHLLQKQLLSI
ncbi:ATP-binding cassette domain-containing protein [Macrococcus capreoli]